MECPPRKWFRCGSEYHLISKFTKPPKENEKRQRQVVFRERGNCASHKSCDNKNDQNIYASMARMSANDKCSSRDFGDSS